MTFQLLKNSLLVAFGTTAAASLLGFVIGVWTFSASARVRNAVIGLAIASFALPAFVQVNCWIELFGVAGAYRSFLPFNLYSIPGAISILTLLLWPIAFAFVVGALNGLDPRYLEMEPSLRGLTLVRLLLWPIARGWLSRSALFIFVMALNNFTVPALLQVRVLPAQVWVQFETNLQAGSAFLKSIPLVVAPILLLILWKRGKISWAVTTQKRGDLLRAQLGSSARTLFGVISSLLIAASLAGPFWQLCASPKTWEQFAATWSAGWPVVWNTVVLATAASGICLLLSLIVWRFRSAALLWLFFFAPGVLLGIVMVTIFNRGLFDVVYRSLGIIVIAWVIRYLAISWQVTRSAFARIDFDLTASALLARASRWQQFRFVQGPLMTFRLGIAWYLVFLLCLWDVETILLILPPGGETLSVRIFGLLHYGHNSQVNALCLILLLVALAPLGLFLLSRAFRVRSVALALFVAAFVAGCQQQPAASLNSRLFTSVEVIGHRGAGAGEFNKPRSIAVDRNDNLYVVDMTGRIQKFSPDGKFLLSWQMPQTDLGKPKGMGIDRQGNIVVVEPHYQRVNHFSPEGKLVSQWGKSGTNRGELTLPRSIAINSRGQLFVTEYTRVDRVQGFSENGAEAFLLIGQPGSGPGEFNRAEGVAVDSQDRIYIADSCNHRVQVFSQSGKWLRSYGRPGKNPGEMSYPYDLRVDSAGRQFVCEFGNSRIQIFDSNDQTIEILGGPGGRPGEFSNPWTIALNSRGDLYVCDTGNHRIQKFMRR